MRNILLLGGSGFIGLNIVDILIKNDDYRIVILTRDKVKTKNVLGKLNSKSNITIIEGDLTDIEGINNIISKFNVEIIVHLVSNMIPASREEDFYEELSRIVIPTYRLIDYIALKNIKLFYFSSGGTIYGKSGRKHTELENPEPISYYGYSKFLIEAYIQFKHRTEGLRYIILRPSNAYGRYQRSNRSQGFIAVSVSKLIKNKVIEIWGDGSVIRDYIEVQDLADVFLKLLKNNIENEIFNIGSGEAHSLLETLNIEEKILNKKAQVVYQDRRSVDADKVLLDISKLRKHINFNPKSIVEGISLYLKYLGDENDK